MESSQTPLPKHIVLCPCCPKCGEFSPDIHPLFYQTFCRNEDCDVFMWVPWLSAEDNLRDPVRISWEESDRQD